MFIQLKADGSLAPSSCAWLLLTNCALSRRRKSFAVWPCACVEQQLSSPTGCVDAGYCFRLSDLASGAGASISTSCAHLHLLVGAANCAADVCMRRWRQN